ncbi:hypothetical protein LSH36_334g00007 [Paralvinella palmiformis]|uniref:Uncharacterized protein n=1 Tax=Paralvinella palmiformis TaxID=53620 RepID=A0AAD9JFK9_9ANNE|nr:hypothetical protein LSH36_334g00007 [Paralvinella palmiformis]
MQNSAPVVECSRDTKRRLTLKTYPFREKLPSKSSIRLGLWISIKRSLIYDTIVLSSMTYTVENLAELPNDLKAVVGCDEADNVMYVYGSQCPLSNFYQAKFIVSGIVFSYVEQAYLCYKAVHYCDKSKSAQILPESRPQIHKNLGESFGKRD